MYNVLTNYRIYNSLIPVNSRNDFLEDNLLEKNSHFELLLLKIKVTMFRKFYKYGK